MDGIVFLMIRLWIMLTIQVMQLSMFVAFHVGRLMAWLLMLLWHWVRNRRRSRKFRPAIKFEARRRDWR